MDTRCNFSEQEIFTFLDTNDNTSKIKSCKNEFAIATYNLLHTNKFKTNLTNNCPVLNPYQLHKLNQLNHTQLYDAFTIKDIIYSNNKTVTPLDSKCHADIIKSYNAHSPK
jgi:hypothetical protein